MAVSSKLRPKSDTLTHVCVCCGYSKRADQVYVSRNKLMDSMFSICKPCATKEAGESIEGFHRVLMLLDIPFLPQVYELCQDDPAPFSSYVKRLGNPNKRDENGNRYQDLRYADSPSFEQCVDIKKFERYTDDDYLELEKRFGDWWTKEQLYLMAQELAEMFTQYGGSSNDLAYLNLYCEVITLKWMAREQLKKGDTQRATSLLDQRQKLLKSNGLTLQDIETKKRDDSFGERIDWAEWEPIYPDKKYYDVDGIEFMWKKLISQLLRFVGVNKSPVTQEAIEMIDFVKNNPNYCQDME